MKYRTFARLLVASCSFIALPACLSAQDKKPESAKPAANAPVFKLEQPDAAWKELQSVEMPKFDGDRRQDKEYVKSFLAQREAAFQKKAKLGEAFAQKFPNDPRKLDALFIRAESLGETDDRDAFVKAAQTFVDTAPKDDERAPALLFNLLLTEEDDARQTAQLHDFLQRYPRGETADQVKAMLRLNTTVGKPFELPTFKDAISGKEVSPQTLKGKVVVVDFWATWCGPCVAEMPRMKEIYAKYKDKGVEFVGVSLDNPESDGGLANLKEFVAQNQVPWPQYYQGNGWEGAYSKSWGIAAIPRVLVVDADGNLSTTRGLGKLDEILPELLKKAGKQAAAR